MKILELNVENFLGVEAVDVTPETDVVVIGGRNAQGKSSVLNGIIAALGGAKGLPAEPLRRGAENGHVRITIERPEGNLIVERRFTEKGTTLKVSSADGASYSKPQQLLDSLIGAIGFDPHAFIRLDEKKQAEQLRGLVGLDFSDFDERRAELYEERTAINRTAKQLQARLESMLQHPDAPAEEVSIHQLMVLLQLKQEANQDNDRKRRQLEDAQQEVKGIEAECLSIEQQIIELQERLQQRQAVLSEVKAEAEKFAEYVSALEDADVEATREQLANAEEINRKVRANMARAEDARELEATLKEAKRLTALIEEIDAAKQKQLEEAPWPVPGLGFDESGVTYNGLPLAQASSAEQLRVSLAMGMALNPKLRVLIIRDGSLLDDDTMEVIRQMVSENGYQLWLEKVSSDGQGCSIVIREGKVAELVA